MHLEKVKRFIFATKNFEENTKKNTSDEWDVLWYTTMCVCVINDLNNNIQ